MIGRVIGIAGMLVLAGCASMQPEVSARAEMGNPKVARGSVAVVADVSMADATEATRLATQVAEALKAAGFQVKSTPDEADVIVIPSLAYSSPSVDEATDPPFSRTGFQPATVGNQSGMTTSTFSFSSLDEYRAPSAPAAPQKCGLRVTAVTKKDWFDTEKSRNVERVWRVIAVTAVDGRSQEEITAELVQAATVKFRAVQAAAAGSTSAPKTAH